MVINSHAKRSKRAGKYVLILLLVLTIFWLPLCLIFIHDVYVHSSDNRKIKKALKQFNCYEEIPNHHNYSMLRYDHQKKKNTVDET